MTDSSLRPDAVEQYDAGVRLDRDGPVATVTLCRPHVHNAQTPPMWAALRSIGASLPADIRLVVITGQGRSFSAGLDLSAFSNADDQIPSVPVNEAGTRNGAATGAESATGGRSTATIDPGFGLAGLARAGDAEASARLAGYQAAFAWLRRADLISVAAVRGHAIGAGFQLALACDFRILTEDAKLTMAEVSLGLVPDLGGTRRLVELVGYARALEICVIGRRIGAEQALRWGLATSVVPGDDLDRAVAELTGQVLGVPRDATVEVKALLAAAALRSFPDQEVAEREAQLRRIRDLLGQGE
jgi:enoyl-CoA hydratase/carnithine racemase